MKMKYTAAFALVAWLLVAGWLASMVIAKPAVLRMGNQAEETAAMAELRNAINRNRQAVAALATLRDSQFPVVDTGNVVALPVAAASPAEGGRPGAHTTGTRGSDPAIHAVSMVLVTNGKRSAIIDGQHVRTGTRLGDGSRVGTIGPDWVRIQGADGESATHSVPLPYQPVTGAAR
ncbi:hypothetical protein ABB34_00415 [Stenotrophomonas daejeonensis]|uniref:Uncharacterized protein n=1 Tax=Stenotrophomonas daejeonensis TaxID=659018 RepID=A0A0R0EE05_9GAMM|nr:hypothetical protein [Stenotrophomonas daejeonensis]KRG88302.1 hypothetical protein ABB34_00415 [Stenotrophomonas daejeonensis]